MKDKRHHIHGLQKKVLQDAKQKLAYELESKRQEEEAQKRRRTDAGSGFYCRSPYPSLSAPQTPMD
jgi:hypothetical protein